MFLFSWICSVTGWSQHREFKEPVTCTTAVALTISSSSGANCACLKRRFQLCSAAHMPTPGIFRLSSIPKHPSATTYAMLSCKTRGVQVCLSLTSNSRLKKILMSTWGCSEFNTRWTKEVHQLQVHPSVEGDHFITITKSATSDPQQLSEAPSLWLEEHHIAVLIQTQRRTVLYTWIYGLKHLSKKSITM